VIAFGDFRQIPPIERDSSALKGIRFSDDIYALNSIPELVLRQAPVEGLSVLTEQYRMPDQLASLVSAFAYPERPLTTPQFIEAGSVLSPKAVITIDTASIAEPDQRLRISLEAKGRTNSVHASLVAMCVTRLIDSGDLNPDWITDQLAVLAPYRKQVSELRRVLSVVHGRKVATAVTTIHRMQGHERPFIILDLVHSEGSPLGRLMQGTTILDKGPRILNVAISRAQRQLIVIADLTHISGQGGRQTSSHIGSGMQRLAQLLGPTALSPNIVTEWTLLP
jgi:superfamily I DNA and/or RNA helicase